jgi:hypothetical protein
VLACGVDVAADAGAVLGGVFAGEPAGDFLLGFRGPYSALRDVVRGPHGGVGGEQEHVVFAVAAEFELAVALTNRRTDDQVARYAQIITAEARRWTT